MRHPSAEKGESGFAEGVGRKEKRLLEVRGDRAGKGLSWIGTIGIVGWCVTVPMLAGIALGRWLDARFKGPQSFTIMLLVGGLFLGCAIAWAWVRKRLELGGADVREEAGIGRDRREPTDRSSEDSHEGSN